MSDAGDAVSEARARIKKIAARMVVRKEALEAELVRLEADHARVKADLDAVGGSEGAGSVGEEAAKLVVELASRIETKKDEIAVVEADIRSALADFDELARTGRDAERAELRAIVDGATGGDPVIRSPQEIALENVRSHIDELEARVALDRELAGASGGRASTPSLPRESAEDRARAQLAELKAKRDKARAEKSEGAGAAGGEPAADAETGAGEGAPRPPKPKRTL